MTFTINGKNIYQIGSKSEKKYIHQLNSFQFLMQGIISTTLLVSEDILWLIVHILLLR